MPYFKTLNEGLRKSEFISEHQWDLLNSLLDTTDTYRDPETRLNKKILAVNGKTNTIKSVLKRIVVHNLQTHLKNIKQLFIA